VCVCEMSAEIELPKSILKLRLYRNSDLIVLKMADGITSLPTDWDPSDGPMFLPLQVEGFRDGYHSTLFFITENWWPHKQGGNTVCEWRLDDTWPNKCRRNVVIALRDWICSELSAASGRHVVI